MDHVKDKGRRGSMQERQQIHTPTTEAGHLRSNEDGSVALSFG
ncbi:hypothetical protein L798_13231 [Zootermopsis nevadensis]|uniref:Uncharacterized protein n=1 Tax=Zootermopsis nevadensis TaxID=136037 RepID=A0A067RL39_ZOONE|nr:hypothetical protein L798_13231 [Zootermopsis nevadensis]